MQPYIDPKEVAELRKAVSNHIANLPRTKFKQGDLVFISKYNTYGVVAKPSLYNDLYSVMIKREFRQPTVIDMCERDLEQATIESLTFTITKKEKLLLYYFVPDKPGKNLEPICPAWTFYRHKERFERSEYKDVKGSVSIVLIKTSKQLVRLFSIYKDDEKEFNRRWKIKYRSRQYKIGDVFGPLGIEIARRRAAIIDLMEI